MSITRHCYYQDGGDHHYNTIVELPGVFSSVVFAGYLDIDHRSDYRQVDSDPLYINNATAKLRTYKSLEKFCKVEKFGDREKLVFHTMPPSFTCVIKTKSSLPMKKASKFFKNVKSIPASELAEKLFSETSIAALNHLLFRCEAEEREISDGKRGPYGLDKYGVFKYAGIASFMTIYRRLKVSGDMGHELFDNMRKGNWYLEYA